jgi:hypothetical protein
MADVNVSLDASDIPVILEALIFKKAALNARPVSNAKRSSAPSWNKSSC